MKTKLLGFLFLLLPIIAFADYDSNFRGKIAAVLTYPYSSDILIRVEGQPSSHAKCSRFDYMVVDGDVSAEHRQIVLSRILLAYASGEVVNIGYDAHHECGNGSRVKIYRVG